MRARGWRRRNERLLAFRFCVFTNRCCYWGRHFRTCRALARKASGDRSVNGYELFAFVIWPVCIGVGGWIFALATRWIDNHDGYSVFSLCYRSTRPFSIWARHVFFNALARQSSGNQSLNRLLTQTRILLGIFLLLLVFQAALWSRMNELSGSMAALNEQMGGGQMGELRGELHQGMDSIEGKIDQLLARQRHE